MLQSAQERIAVAAAKPAARKRAAKPARPAPPDEPAYEHAELWLLGQPSLSRLLEFAEDTGVEGGRVDRAALAREWRRGVTHYQELERREAGIANLGEHRDLDPSLARLAAQVQREAAFRGSFDTLPTRFGMVELDRLIVSQMHVTRNFVAALQARLGPAPDPQALFRYCMRTDAEPAPVQIRRVGQRRYVFRCPSTDFRFHEPALLGAQQTQGYESFGAVAGILGLVVGFGSNYLNAVQVGRRMLLNNGYHRAVALRALGITHAPCVIQTASCIDELQISVKSRVAEDAEFYFESARPPLLRDFFDPQIRKLLPIRPRVRQIEVSFDIKDYLIAE